MHMLTPRALAAPATIAAVAVLVTAPGSSATPHARQPAPIGGARLGGHGLLLNPAAGVQKPPKVSASSYVIADADTGQILAAKDPHGYYRPASTLKILTAVTLIPRLDQNKVIKPSWKACNTEGSRVGIVPNMKYKISDLFRGMLMVSGNDAAVSLAQQPPGGMTKTLELMNTEAKRLQGYDTVAKTPNGLDRKGQHSSAYDLALFARHGLQDPRFRDYIGKVSFKFPAPATKKERKKKKSGGFMIYNHDRLLTQYKGGMGVKNGYTTKAMGTFVGAAKRNGHTILIALMHSKPFFWDDAKHMLTWGFSARGKVRPVGGLVGPAASAKPSPTASTMNQTPAAHARPGASGSNGLLGGIGVPAIAIACGVLILFGGVGYTVARRRRRWFS
ncbi:MAG TPA: D-alanyl-D-alanine carboxypeptidase [Streptosporangiaceae bacterium]|jgi:D-alanyl-D-alanine carboxypeptidase (penicillin-binding protein 5/6)